MSLDRRAGSANSARKQRHPVLEFQWNDRIFAKLSIVGVKLDVSARDKPFELIFFKLHSSQFSLGR